jgi:hypothetical protein
MWNRGGAVRWEIAQQNACRQLRGHLSLNKKELCSRNREISGATRWDADMREQWRSVRLEADGRPAVMAWLLLAIYFVAYARNLPSPSLCHPPQGSIPKPYSTLAKDPITYALSFAQV